jgi:hypothetical protein
MTKSLMMSVVALLVLGGCKKDEAANTQGSAQTTTPAAPNAPMGTAPGTVAAFKVQTVTLGNAVTPEKTVAAPLTTFKPTDTIYASVRTEGTADAVPLKAKWTYKGEKGEVQVDEREEKISTQVPANTVFQISKPDGFPAGGYRVEIFAGGTSVSQAEFTVAAAGVTGSN